jgi:hypothetical protein
MEKISAFEVEISLTEPGGEIALSGKHRDGPVRHVQSIVYNYNCLHMLIEVISLLPFEDDERIKRLH